MPTLQQLEKENEKLRNQLKGKQELVEIGKKRNELLKQNKLLLMKLKGSETAQGVRDIATKFGRTSGRVGVKFGKQIFRGFQSLEKKRLENERKARGLKRKPTKNKSKTKTKRKR